MVNGPHNKGRRQNSLPLTTNFSQNVTEPSKGISYPAGDLCRCFTKLTGPCAYTLHSNPIAPTDGTNGLLLLVAYISQTGHQCFPACFCHPTVGKFYVSLKGYSYRHNVLAQRAPVNTRLFYHTPREYHHPSIVKYQNYQ